MDMDMASSSYIKYADERMEIDTAEGVIQRKRKHMDDNDDIESEESEMKSYSDGTGNDSCDSSSGIDIEAKNRVHFEKHLPYLRHVITECELRRRKSIKRRRMHVEPVEFSDVEKMYHPDDELSSSSLTNVSTCSDSLYNECDYDPESVEEPIELTEKEDRIFLGSWMILSFVEGGWRYDQVKNFFMEKYEIKCIKSKIVSERLAIKENNQNFYQAIVRFDTKKKLNLVLGDLIKRKIDDKFMFVSADRLPLSDNTEEWCKGERFNEWLRILNNV